MVNTDNILQRYTKKIEVEYEKLYSAKNDKRITAELNELEKKTFL